MPASHPVSHPRRHALLALALALAGICTPLLAQTSTWPSKPITLVVPFPAGGGTDLVVRALQPRLQKELGQPLVIDNRAGAGGTLGSALVARATPDGYTAGVATTSTHAVSVSVFPKLPFDPAKDFAYAGFIGTSPYVLATTGGLGSPTPRLCWPRSRPNPRASASHRWARARCHTCWASSSRA
jgi:tripartite-type tricarboxylate transporter receptor subunit TctC